MIPPETLEEVQKLLDELRELSAQGAPIIVEGKNDSKALRDLNMEGPIMQISSSKKTALNFLEGLSGHEQVVILTDFDRAGNDLARFCEKHLQKLGIEPILDPRKKLKFFLRKGIKDIESLEKFLRSQTAKKN
jgi:5S rRNA maturation endonuclease (ribonuclease M5)